MVSNGDPEQISKEGRDYGDMSMEIEALETWTVPTRHVSHSS